MKSLKSFFIFSLLGLCFSTSVLAINTADPMAMMRSISNNMLSALKQNRPRLKSNPKFINTLVNRYVLPYVDVQGMSRTVIGRTAWNQASNSEHQAFSKAFTNVVINTYASALNAYKDETIKFFPLRGGFQGRNRVQIQSQVIRPDGPPIPVNYRLANFNNTWKIYDLNVEGVGLLQSFRSQFASQLSQGKNLTQITQKLNNKN